MSSEMRQRKPASTPAAPPQAPTPGQPGADDAGPGLDPSSQFAGGGSVDLSLGPWLTTALLVLPCLFIYFQFWPLIKEELDKGEPLFAIPSDVKEDLKEVWGIVRAKLGFR